MKIKYERNLRRIDFAKQWSAHDQVQHSHYQQQQLNFKEQEQQFPHPPQQPVMSSSFNNDLDAQNLPPPPFKPSKREMALSNNIVVQHKTNHISGTLIQSMNYLDLNKQLETSDVCIDIPLQPSQLELQDDNKASISHEHGSTSSNLV